MNRFLKYLFFTFAIIVANFLIFLGPYLFGYSWITGLLVKDGFFQSTGFKILITICTLILMAAYYLFFIDNINKVAKCYKYKFLFITTFLCSTVFAVLFILTVFTDAIPSIFFRDTYKQLQVYLETKDNKLPTYNVMIVPQIITYFLNLFACFVLVSRCEKCGMIGLEASKIKNYHDSGVQTETYERKESYISGTTQQHATVTYSDGTTGHVTISQDHYSERPVTITHKYKDISYTTVCKYCGHKQEHHHHKDIEKNINI